MVSLDSIRSSHRKGKRKRRKNKNECGSFHRGRGGWDGRGQDRRKGKDASKRRQESGRREEMQILEMPLRAWGEDERHVAGL